MKPLFACACALAAALALAAPATAQTTRGSDLQAAPNVAFGCESTPSYELFGFAIVPHEFPSCSWWSTGSAGLVGDPRNSAVPATGRVTTVRIRAGDNPAPVRVVINRILRRTGGESMCCQGVVTSDVLPLQPNQVNTFAVNLPVESVRDDEQGIAWFDYVGISAAAGTGNLPLHDQAAELGQGAHSPEAALSPSVITASMTAPELLPSDGPRVTQRGAPGYEVLLQYDHVACPTAPNGQPIARAAQAGCGQAAAPPPGGGAPVGSQVPEFLGGAGLRAVANRVAVPVRCGLTVDCRGVLRIRTRGAAARTLAQLATTVPAGQTVTLRPRLNARGRRLVRGGRKVAARLVLALGTGGVFTRNVTLRR